MVGFGHYQDATKARRPEWAPKFISYGNLKRMINELVREAAAARRRQRGDVEDGSNVEAASGSAAETDKKEKKKKKQKSKGHDSDSDEPPVWIYDDQERVLYASLLAPAEGGTQDWYARFREALNYEVQKAGQAHTSALRQLRTSVLLLNQAGRATDDSIALPHSRMLEAEHALAIHSELEHLKQFSALQRTAIRKIVKKLNKALLRSRLDPDDFPVLDTQHYLQMFDTAGRRSSEDPSSPTGGHTAERLIEQLEVAYAELHHDEDIASARQHLLAGKSGNIDMLLLGVALGLLIPSLICVAALYVQEHKAVKLTTFWTLLPLYRALLLINLWLWVWALDLMYFNRALINHTYILEIKPQKQLSYVSLFQAAAGFTVLNLINFAVHFLLHGQKHVHYTLFVLWGAFAVLLLPLPVFFWETRYAFLHVIRKLFVLPVWIPIRAVHSQLPSWMQVSWRRIPELQKVRFREFFIADQLTSAPILLADILYAGCFSACGAWKKTDDAEMIALLDECACVDFVNSWKPSIVLWPFIWRFIQCLVMLKVTGSIAHLFNACKYSTGIIVPIAAVMSSKDAGSDSLWAFWTSSVFVSQTYCLVWDVLIDWGCILWCNRDADRTHREHRSRRHLVPKGYLLALIPLDAMARYAGITTVSEGMSPYDTDPRLLLVFLGVIETMRRGAWNVFRMENEQLHNLEGYRASSDSVPPAISLIYGEALPWQGSARVSPGSPTAVRRMASAGSSYGAVD
eukprot:TRINITY_DN15826_c0_g1_i1.p1 TRINITY_DN15826_c0_g1~~TRINITY_DN15826_c0_g1_i1.p1  ORF type:complete len:743 (+),score=196.19 TRINITY_DN15826_c0_g1_i1:68-2296(+)